MQHEQRGAVLSGHLVKPRSQHPEQATENGKPTHKRYKHGPAARPPVVSPDEPKASDKEQGAREVNDRSNLGFIEMRIYKFRFG